MLCLAIVTSSATTWLSRQSKEFAEGIDTLAQSRQLELRVPARQVRWRQGIIVAEDVAVSLPSGGGLPLEIPRVEIDFHPMSVFNGWDTAIWQVYLHRPVFPVSNAGIQW